MSDEVTVYASAARTATPAAVSRPCSYARGLHLVVDVTAIVTTPSIVVTVDALDVLSGKFYNLITSAALVAVGTTVLRVYPGATPAANLAVNDCLTETVRVTVTHGNANSITYSVSAHLMQ